MRVLMLNRRDAFDVVGGDTIQMMETKASLEKLGVEVSICTEPDIARYSGYEILHVFNWEQLPVFIPPTFLQSTSRPKILLSTIFWYHSGHWFDKAAQTKALWRTLKSGLGPRLSLDLYQGWQQAKFRWDEKGRATRSLLLQVDGLLPNSQVELRHLEDVLGLSGRLNAISTVVPNAISKTLFDPLPAPNRAFAARYNLDDFVLQVARIQSAKNQLGLLQALFDLPVPIVFIGQASPYELEYVGQCKALAERRGQVYFIDPLPLQDLVSIYALGGVHALPSWRETPGLASLEAAAAGCRIVSTAIGSASEYFGDEAWYCDPKDNASIRAAVSQALAAPPAPRLRQRILTDYTWDAAAAKTLQAYHRALPGL